MFRLRSPNPETLNAYVDRYRDAPYSYPDVGMTRLEDADLPATLRQRYNVDVSSVTLGKGRACFERARAAILDWRPFEFEWLTLVGGLSPARPEQVVATLTRAIGLWVVNPCRVVYVIGGAANADRAGFAYGTVGDHLAAGEERFDVVIDPQSEEVVFQIRALSRPVHPLARVGYPYLRWVQRRFRDASCRAMVSAVTAPLESAKPDQNR